MATKAEPLIARAQCVVKPRPDMGGRPSVAPLDSQAQLDAAIGQTRDQVGLRAEAVPLYLPEGWTRLDFPLDRPDKAHGFVRSAFRYGGWRLLAAFRQDLALAYRGIPQSVAATLPSREKMLKARQQLVQAMGILRPEIVTMLDRIEQRAIAVLDARLQATIAAAIDQADRLLVMPSPGGRRIGTQAFLDARFHRGGGLAIRKAPTPLDAGSKDGARFRALVQSLAPAAKAFAILNRAKDLQQALDLAAQAISKGALLSPAATVAATAHAAPAIALGLAAQKDIETLEKLISKHAGLIEAWRQAQGRLSAAKRAAAMEFPLLHRFSPEDLIEAAVEDDMALGSRIMSVLAPIHAGAHSIYGRYVRLTSGSQKALVRPASALRKAMHGQEPPDDPVGYVMKQAKGSIWAHPALIQATIEVMARGTEAEPPFPMLDMFATAVSEQALAEAAALARESSLVEVGKGAGIMAGMIALHCLAPPLALIADAGLAAGDLSTSLADFGSADAEARCTFDPLLSLGEEPSLAWFLASQAFSLLTVG